ncbi:nickel pincer cofactor biosynthesis protein LarC [candidate division KSB1 bacterium]|nr:nickel pincer cofactor biosynthesis protein LarC [candidate division KSB1 bacterium]
MKIAYFDCFSGISGDMILGALLDAGLDFELFQSELTKLNLPNYKLKQQRVSKQNLSATKFDVIDLEKKNYRHLKDLNRIVEESGFDEKLKTRAKEIFLKIADAEAKIHNQSIEQVHFHEISAVDTIIDVVGALVGLKLLNIEKIQSSKLNTGSGFVEFSHGKWPVPAPATAEILKGVPVYATDCKAELVTPTGAAIICTIADAFGDLPEMTTESIGYGAGTQDLEHPNVLRVFIGERKTQAAFEQDTVSILETNIDDMNPQFYDNILEELLQNGALDVYLTNVSMKKNRPGIQLTVLTRPEDEDKFAQIIFRNTTSIGVRIRQEKRKKLKRTIQEVDTKFGKVKFKISNLNGEVLNRTPEYEDCKRISNEQNIPLKVIYKEIEGK